MIRKLSFLLTVALALGLVIALSNCGKKGKLEKPPAETSALTDDHHLG